MNILNKNVQELASKISITEDKTRLAAYAGLAYGYVEKNRKDLVGIGTGEAKMKVYDLFYSVNEVAVVDKDMFIDTVNKFIKFLNEPLKTDSLIMSFDDLAGINNVFGKATVEAINENIALFRDVKNIFKKIEVDHEVR